MVSNNSKEKLIRITFYLLIFFSLAVPALVYLITYSPSLTDRLSEEISLAGHLSSNGSHFFADGWTSSREFIPFSPRFFMTFFATEGFLWQSVLLKSVMCSYLLFCAAYAFFVTSLHAKHFLPYILCSVLGIVLSFYSLYATYDCNYFITYITIVLLTLGLILHGIRSRLPIPIRVIIASLGIIPPLLIFILMRSLSTNSSFKTISPASFTRLFSSPINPSKLGDITEQYNSLVQYLGQTDNECISSSPALSNAVYTLSGGKIRLATAPSFDALTDCTQLDCAYVSTQDIVDYVKPFSYIIPTASAGSYSDYSLISSEAYSDTNYCVIHFDRPELISCKAYLKDWKTLDSTTYDTTLITMYDVSNWDLSCLNVFKLWNCERTVAPINDINIFDLYNDYIFSGKNNIERYFLCIDPYMLFESVEFEKNAYIDLLASHISTLFIANPETVFYLYFPTYSYEHFLNYSSSDYGNLTYSYTMLFALFNDYENIIYNYAGDDLYILGNKYIFEDNSDGLMKPDVAQTYFSETIAEYFLKSPEEITGIVIDYENIVANAVKYATAKYDLSDYYTVILGDSIFAHFKDDTSIQSMLRNFGGAHVIDRSVGGTSAATYGNINFELQAQLDVTAIKDALSASEHTNERLLFIIEYGINDYLLGHPIINENDSYDWTTFSGALQQTVSTLREEWPDCRILFLAPGYSNINELGSIPFVDDGYPLSDYREAVIAVARNNNCDFIDMTKIGINESNFHKTLYPDPVHYNANGRYYIGMSILDYITNN